MDLVLYYELLNSIKIPITNECIKLTLLKYDNALNKYSYDCKTDPQMVEIVDINTAQSGSDTKQDTKINDNYKSNTFQSRSYVDHLNYNYSCNNRTVHNYSQHTMSFIVGHSTAGLSHHGHGYGGINTLGFTGSKMSKHVSSKTHHSGMSEMTFQVN